MRTKLLFIGRFMAIFGGLIFLGNITDAGSRYARALQATAAFASPLANGWSLEERTGPHGKRQLLFRRGALDLRFLLSLDALALGLLPLLSLLGATPGLGLKRLLSLIAVGVVGLFLLDLAVVLLYPALMSERNAFTDIVGTFLGLLTFVGGPVILWFALTYDKLRSVWQLS